MHSSIRSMLLVLLQLLLAHAADATLLRGQVRDTDGESLPYATISADGSTNSILANVDGYYELELPPGEHRISCQLVGYKKEISSITIKAGDTGARLDFALRDDGALMREVVVLSNAEDPAYAMIRAAIRKRPEHLRQVRSFQSSVYLKGVLRLRNTPGSVMGIRLGGSDKSELNNALGVDSNGKGVLYLCEELADYYAAQPDKERTVIRKVRESGSPNGLGMAQLPSVVTFYENNVQVWGNVTPRGLVSPVADGALNFYRYKLVGTYSEGDYTIAKIEVTPKRLYEPLVGGFIYLVEDEWSIHSLSLNANSKNGIETLDTLRIEQQFFPLKKDTWVIQSQVIFPSAQILGFGIAGSFVTNYSRQQVNAPLPDSIFNRRIVSSYDRGANKQDTAFWTAHRPLALQSDEVRDYQRRDSIYLVSTDSARLDTLRRAANRISVEKVLLSGISYNGKRYRSSFATAGLLNVTNYNTVEGLNIAPKFRYTRWLQTGSTIQLKSALRYGFANRHFNGIADLTYIRKSKSWAGRYWSIGAAGGKYVFQLNPDNPVSPVYNTVSSILYRQNYLKLFERSEWTVHFDRNGGNGWAWRLGASYQERFPLGNSSSYDWAKASRPAYSPNLPADLAGYGFEYHRAAVLSGAIQWQPGFTYIQYPDYLQPLGSEQPVFRLAYEKAIPGIGGSRADFDKWRFSVKGDLPLKLFGILSYNLAAGGFLNSRYVALPDLMHLNGNQYLLAAPYLSSFQLAPYYRFSNKEPLYGEAHVEYNMKGLLTNKIPFLRQAQWYFVPGFNAFYANENLWYAEAFFSIDKLGYKLYRFLRLDLVGGRDNARREYYGIRLGLTLNGAINIGSFGNGNASLTEGWQ